MKNKILILITTLFILFSFFSIKIDAKQDDLIDLENVKVNISGSDKSDISLEFFTKEEILDLRITITYYLNDVKQKHMIYSSGLALGDTCKAIKIGVLENDVYAYEFLLKSYAKISTFGLTFNYSIDGEEHEQYLSITNGNPNIPKEIFTIKNGIIIGLIVSIFAVFGTYIIIKNSEKTLQIDDDETVKIVDKKGEKNE